MHIATGPGILFFVLLGSARTAADGVEWRQVFQDNFERAQPGEQYEAKPGKAAIEKGSLAITGEDAMVLLNVGTARDVRVEFDAMPYPGGKHGGIGCLLHSGSGAHYRFEYGGKDNTVTQIVGSGLNRVDDRPGVRIEAGRWRHFMIQREGKQLTLKVDDQVTLEGAVEKVVGPAGIQRIALLTAHGALVDNLRIYNRVPAHPDCCPPPLPWLPLTRKGRQVMATPDITAPGLEEALAALNTGRFDEARQRFETMQDVTLRLAGLAYILGDLNYYEKPVYGYLNEEDRDKKVYSEAELAAYYGEFGLLAARWEAEAQRHPENPVLKAYVPYMRNVGRMVLSRWHTFRHAPRIAELDERISPFHHKARLYLARSTYWNGMEGANEKLKKQAIEEMRPLLALWPDNRVLREYAGEAVVWGEELNADPQKHPAWAAFLREAYAREIAILERSCELRQTPDGQFGGGWGDDVEMLRRWVPIAAISSCSKKVTTGIERLAEGVWSYVLKDGYDKGFGDVEHSAEPSADSVPTMLLLRYGDPRWVEYNLRSCKTIRDLFMGIDGKGFPRFKSAHFGVREVGTGPSAGGDTGYHARVMKHFLWAAWRGDATAREWYLRWVDGWRAAGMLDLPDKPAGVLPGSLWYPSGSHEPPNQNTWFSEDRAHPYGAMGLPAMIHDCFLSAYAFSGNEKYLRPVQRMMDWATLGPLTRAADHNRMEPGTADWFRLPMAHTARATHTALYRMLTGERVYDEYTRRFGTPPQIYQIDHDLNGYMKSIENAAASLRTNLWYRSTEVQSTDRLNLPAVEAVFGAYTGAILLTGDTDFPTFAVTYDTPSTDFAALVVENTSKRLRVWLYSFWEKPTTINLRVWQLVPGRYLLNEGGKVKGEFPFQGRYQWGRPRQVPITHRAQAVPVTLPPNVEYVVDLRLDEAVAVPAQACDLAVHPRDVTVQGDQLSITVHNIGNGPAEDFSVALQKRSGETWQTLSARKVSRLSPPAELVPIVERISFEVPALDLNDRYRFVLDPEEALYEIGEDNNIAEVSGQLIVPLSAPPGNIDPALAGLSPNMTINLGGDMKIDLTLVPPGEFTAALTGQRPEASAGAGPRRVRIDRPFYLGSHLITKAQWKEVVRDREFEGDGGSPATGITREQAEKFCDRLSKRIWRRVRLPSEAEWAYALKLQSDQDEHCRAAPFHQALQEGLRFVVDPPVR